MNAKKFKLKEKKWLLKIPKSDGVNERIRAIADELGINPIIANLLYGRGYTDAASATKFLYMESEVLTDPYDMADMMSAIARISEALSKNERITVYGDYDVDSFYTYAQKELI